jgi:hypothetical protein
MSQRTPSRRSLDPVPEAYELESYSSHLPEIPPNRTETQSYGFNNTTSQGERGDDTSQTTPGGSTKVGFSSVRWWRDNVALALPVDADVRDHFGL